MSRLTELAQEREALLAQVAQIDAEIRAVLTDNTQEAAPVKRGRAIKVRTSQEETTDRQQPMHQIVRNIIADHPGGIPLITMVNIVTRMRDSGEIKTTAKSLSSVVNSAVHHLLAENEVTRKKEEAEGRSRFCYMIKTGG